MQVAAVGGVRGADESRVGVLSLRRVGDIPGELSGGHLVCGAAAQLREFWAVIC